MKKSKVLQEQLSNLYNIGINSKKINPTNALIKLLELKDKVEYTPDDLKFISRDKKSELSIKAWFSSEKIRRGHFKKSVAVQIFDKEMKLFANNSKLESDQKISVEESFVNPSSTIVKPNCQLLIPETDKFEDIKADDNKSSQTETKTPLLLNFENSITDENKTYPVKVQNFILNKNFKQIKLNNTKQEEYGNEKKRKNIIVENVSKKMKIIQSDTSLINQNLEVFFMNNHLKIQKVSGK
jgi:hypothetical protein